MDNRATAWLQSVLFQPNGRLAWIGLALVSAAAGILAGSYIAVLTPVYALGLAGALVVGLLMLRSTQWGFFALISVACLLPFAALPVNVGFRPTLLDLVLLTLFFVWIMSLVTGRLNDVMAVPLGWAVVLFLALACASFVAGLSHARASSYVIRHFAEILLAISLFFVLVSTVRTRQQLQQLVRVIILATSAEAAIAVVLNVMPATWAIRLLSALGRLNYPTGAGVLRYVEDNPDLPLRAIGTSVDPNVLGGLMILAGGLLAPQLFDGQRLFKRWLAAGMLGAVAICLYLTHSRAAMLGFGVSLLVLGVLRYRKLLIVLAIAGVLMMVLPQTAEYRTHMFEGLQLQDRATQMRLGEYKDAFILIQRYPLLGVGFAGSPDIDTYIGVSSAYLLMAEQMGLIGVAAFLLIIVWFFAYTLRNWRRLAPADELQPLLLGAVAALSGALVAGVLDHYFFNFDFPHSVSLFWLYVGLGAAAAHIGRTRLVPAR